MTDAEKFKKNNEDFISDCCQCEDWRDARFIHSKIREETIKRVLVILEEAKTYKSDGTKMYNGCLVDEAIKEFEVKG